MTEASVRHIFDTHGQIVATQQGTTWHARAYLKCGDWGFSNYADLEFRHHRVTGKSA